MTDLDEKRNRKLIGKFSFIYGFILIIANLLGSMIPQFLDDVVIQTENMLAWIKFMDDNKTVIRIVSGFTFVIPTLACVLYLRNAKTNEKLLRRIIGLPGVYACLGTLGWFWYLFSEIVFLLIFKYTSPVSYSIRTILFQSFMFASLDAMFTFVCAYFLTEMIHRKFLLPKIFPEGKIAEVKGAFHPILWLMFVIFYIAVGFFPIVYLLYDGIIIRSNYGIPQNTNLILVIFLLIVTGICVTIILARLFTKPIHKLTESTKNISKGDYTQSVEIISNDEFGILADTFNDMTKSLAEKEFMRDTFGKVVDPYVRDYLMKGNVVLGGETREITVMFCDIRSFTSMSESMEPSDVVLLLNEYFTALGKCIRKNHGVINKYIGDAIMAIFGAPVESENHAMDAYNSAIEMRAALEELNKSFEARGIQKIRFGIGIHSGKVLAGNIGAENRMEYTVIGDTVNTSSRIESLCKEYKTDLLISESTVNLLTEEIKNGLHFVDEASIRGKEKKIKLFN